MLPEDAVQGRGLHAGEGQRLLVEQCLHPELAALIAVVQRNHQVGGVGQRAAGAEGAPPLRGEVGGRQPDLVLEETQQGEQWEEGLGMAHLDAHRLRNGTAGPGGGETKRRYKESNRKLNK